MRDAPILGADVRNPEVNLHVPLQRMQIRSHLVVPLFRRVSLILLLLWCLHVGETGTFGGFLDNRTYIVFLNTTHKINGTDVKTDVRIRSGSRHRSNKAQSFG